MSENSDVAVQVIAEILREHCVDEGTPDQRCHCGGVMGDIEEHQAMALLQSEMTLTAGANVIVHLGGHQFDAEVKTLGNAGPPLIVVVPES